MSNRALSEYNLTDTGFDYGDLSSIASDHAGPEQFIKDVYQNGYEDGSNDFYNEGYNGGFLDGQSEIITKAVVPLVVTTLSSLVIGGIALYKHHKKNKSEIKKLAEEKAKLKSEKYLQELIEENNYNGPKIISEGNIIYGAFGKESEKKIDHNKESVL